MNERRNLVIAIVVAFVFGLAGGMIGTLATISIVHHHGGGPFFAGGRHPGERGGGDWRRDRGPGRPGRPGRPGPERVLSQLDLSEEQRTRIEGILDAARPRYAAVRESTRVEIDRVLTPEQRTKMKELEERYPGRRRSRAAF